MNNKKIVVSHPTGNANVRYLIDGLALRGMLSFFYTCVAVFKGTAMYFFLEKTPLKEFTKRSFSPEVKGFTRTRPMKELIRVFALKFGFKNLIKHETGKYSVDAIYHDLDKAVACSLKGKDAIYAYEDGALYSFEAAKKNGVICLYDLPIGYWRAMRFYLESERVNRPDWEDTLTGFKDSQIKLERKDNELKLADHIFVASTFTKKTLQMFPGNLPPVHVVPYGFPKVCENRQYQSAEGRKIRLLFIGGLSQRKGIANVFEAVEALKDEVTLTVVGRKASEICKPLNDGLEKNRWIEAVPYNEVLSLMREHDVFVFPSLFEGYGLVISEAMSQGTAVITTDRTCGADFIEDDKNGWLVEAGNTQSLINKLKYIIANKHKIADIGRAGAETARKNPSANYGNEMSGIINKLIN